MRDSIGGLVGAIHPSDKGHPSKESTFFIGTGSSYVSPDDGVLFLTVNDVWVERDERMRYLFFTDNVGFFWVKVTLVIN